MLHKIILLLNIHEINKAKNKITIKIFKPEMKTIISKNELILVNSNALAL